MLFLLFVGLLAVSADQTICEKYASLTGKSQIALMTDLVTVIVKGEVSNPKIERFFNGTTPPGSINFLKDQAQYNRLAGNLISFFGAALGCNEPGFPAYKGNPSMKNVHAKMPITGELFSLFNDIFISALGAAGVDGMDLAAVRSLLNSFSTEIINPATICPKYANIATGGNQTALMYTVVNRIVSNELARPLILPFFDGSVPPGSTNFLTNKAAFDNLLTGLVAFFGGALGCSEPGFPLYRGPDMKTVHRLMPIDRDLLDLFNDVFVSVLPGFGVDVFDQSTIRGLLNSFAPAIVKANLICPKYAGLTKQTQISLMTDIVTRVVSKELADPTVKPFFDGTTPPGSINFLNNTNAFNRLAVNLIAFFGGALGCNEAGFPVYSGNPSMRLVHQAMPISNQVFDNFNIGFISALTDAGVTPSDRQTVRDLLDSFRMQLVWKVDPMMI